MNSYGSNKVSMPAGIIGEGGASAVLGRNPNANADLNGSPEGPFSSQLGFKNDGGMTSDATVAGGFHFK